MRRTRFLRAAWTTGAVLLGWACNGTSSGPGAPVCLQQIDGCECTISEAGRATVNACNPSAFPGTTCCADRGWPGSTGTSCECLTGEVYCGVVANYFTDGSSGCVCTLAPYSATQTVGATCYPGGTTTGPALGVCCNFGATSGNEGGIDTTDCACGAGLHTCGGRAPEVGTCSAASYPPPSHTCPAGQSKVDTCLGNPGDAGAAAPADGGDAGEGGAVDGGSEAGVCGSGPPTACNTLANTGSVVTPTCVAGSPPAMTGGTIAYGTYVLSAATAYTSSCSGVSLPTGGPTTMLVSGGCMQTIDVTGGAKTFTWSTTGATLTMNEVCPGAVTANLAYTATATTLSELAPLTAQTQVVSVFQKQ